MQIDTSKQAITDIMTRQVQEQTNFVFDSLVTEKTNSVLPEEIFQGYFLPYFSGQIQIPKNSDLIAKWIGIAGTPAAEVDIIDNTGTVLFTVPSLFDTKALEILKRESGRSLSDIYNVYDMKSNNIPSQAISYLGAALSKKLTDMNVTDSGIKSAIERWRDILARYNLAVDSLAESTADFEDEGPEDLLYDFED